MALFYHRNRAALPLMKEIAVDFATGRPVLDETGDFRLVAGLEAVKVWVWRALQADNRRFAYSAHTDSYGHQMDRLTGLALPEAESRLARMVRETLGVCPYITGVEQFRFTREENRLRAAFLVRTVYGTVTAESEMER
ncbi:MAG: DUF2634 domain-containing protein [Clostridia bacterium]|nr:DUF2634 domain-containing protein [Clostridia bacterium]